MLAFEWSRLEFMILRATSKSSGLFMSSTAFNIFYVPTRKEIATRSSPAVERTL